jgi:hypothetical protein
LSPEQIVSMLVAEGALPGGCAVNSMIWHDDDSATVDMNAAYHQAVNSGGTAREYMIIGSLVNTLVITYGLTELTITIDGNVLETGHEVYDYPLEYHPH